MKIMELTDAVRERIVSRYVRAIYGALTKPPSNGAVPKDVERIVTDLDLANFITLMKDVYKPIMLLIEVNRSGDVDSPPPDDRRYFGNEDFGPSEEYDPVISDSQDELYLINSGKRKPKSWPRTDHGFEHEKARVRKRIGRLTLHLREMQARHKKLRKDMPNDIIDSDNEDCFYWSRWLNPQTGKDYVRARMAAVVTAASYKRTRNVKRAEEVAIESYGQRGTGDFNIWDGSG
jgi:hypothetical protein